MADGKDTEKQRDEKQRGEKQREEKERGEEEIAWAGLGEASGRRGDWASAADCYSRSILASTHGTDGPNGLIDGLSRRAYALERQGRLQEALADCQRARQIFDLPKMPARVALDLQLARLLAKLGKGALAEEACQRVLDRWPTCVPALNIMVSAKEADAKSERDGKSRGEGALPYVERLIAAQPDSYEHRWTKARIMRRLNKSDEEISSLSDALALIERFIPQITTPPSIGRTREPPFSLQIRFERAQAILKRNTSSVDERAKAETELADIQRAHIGSFSTD